MTDDRWYMGFEAWLLPRGFYPVGFESSSYTIAGLHILSGQSPRRRDDKAALHSVVARGCEIVHDPHPSRDGILTRKDVVLLVPLDPAIARAA
jgi:hypothetical protein